MVSNTVVIIIVILTYIEWLVSIYNPCEKVSSDQS